MKNKVIALVVVVAGISEVSNAALLYLSGTVPDKGIAVKSNQVEIMQNTDLKVFAAELKSGNWKKIPESSVIVKSSRIRVEAP
jgi:hypothetical protein